MSAREDLNRRIFYAANSPDDMPEGFATMDTCNLLDQLRAKGLILGGGCELVDLACESGDLPVLQNLCECWGFLVDSRAACSAALGGHVAILDYLFDPSRGRLTLDALRVGQDGSRVEVGSWPVCLAAMYNHVDALAWMRSYCERSLRGTAEDLLAELKRLTGSAHGALSAPQYAASRGRAAALAHLFLHWGLERADALALENVDLGKKFEYASDVRMFVHERFGLDLKCMAVVYAN